jgi:hypothetical protein
MLKASKILIVLLISDNKLILIKLEILHLWDATKVILLSIIQMQC